MTAWREVYEGGDPQKERALFEKLADDIMHAQLKTKKAAKAARVDRTFHAKGVLATREAELRFNDDLPMELCAGFAKPGAAYPTLVRFSNAAGAPGADFKPDLRGIALRIHASPEQAHDLLATNYPVSHARNARQFVAFAVATAGGTLSRLDGILDLLFRFGPFELARMLGNVSKARKQKVSSLALTTYWSRGAMRWGPELAVRFLVRPIKGAPPGPEPSKHHPDYLANELARRLSNDDVEMELCVQKFVDERSTPIEDTGVEWKESVSPPIPVATLTLKRQEISGADARANARALDDIAFNPWNTTDEFRPLGNLNRARKVAYDASAHHRLAYRWRSEPPARNVFTTDIALAVFSVINRFRPWHRLSVTNGLLNLDILRHTLRRKNLIDPAPREAPPTARPVPKPIAEEVRVRRNYDGRYNDLSDPNMGKLGAAFGRNIKPVYRPDLFDTPDPIEVSRRLMTRKSFIPARSLNILAAAWIQFQVHDWVNHARKRLGEDDIKLPLPPDMPWRNTPDGPLEYEMRIAGNTGFVENSDSVFSNHASHWWDGSEVYGANMAQAKALREGPKLKLDENGYLPAGESGAVMTGFNESWWLGLAGMHTLFAREHNVLCDELRSHYPGWTDDRIYETARLIVSALIAKIHTVEWTPAILATKTIDAALNANWSGPPNDLITKAGIWLLDTHSSTGIPKTKPDHHSAPYCLTEDFATVYRLHPLIPDDYCFFHHATGAKLSERGFLDIQGVGADAVLRETTLENTLYSLGIAHPGAITLHNFPRSLQALARQGPNPGDPMEMIDLSVIDIVRTRRRGVPRYNDFLAGLHKPRVTRWQDITADPDTAEIMKDVYKGDLDMVDTVIGLLGENPPTGFGFSDTAFRIFLLMATRRIQSDRFLTVDFRPEVYSPFGMDWIANNGMTSIILRHCPELAAVMPRDASAFAPWRTVVERGWEGAQAPDPFSDAVARGRRPEPADV